MAGATAGFGLTLARGFGGQTFRQPKRWDRDEAAMAYHAADNPDRIKALAGVLAVHAALGAAILSGLSVHTVAATIDRLRTFDITEIPPPPPPPPPSPTPERAKEEEGAAAKKALPTPVVAPPPKIVIPAKSPVVASRVPSTGSAATAGAATSGTGTGAGGSGSGLGGGGSGGLARAPQLVAGGPTKSDYRKLGVRVIGATRVIIRLTISPEGRVTECVAVGSSGYREIDAGICPLLQPRMKWAPARDKNGRAIVSWLNFIATVQRN